MYRYTDARMQLIPRLHGRELSTHLTEKWKRVRDHQDSYQNVDFRINHKMWIAVTS